MVVTDNGKATDEAVDQGDVTVSAAASITNEGTEGTRNGESTGRELFKTLILSIFYNKLIDVLNQRIFLIISRT